MKQYIVSIAICLSCLLNAQITLINTGTTSQLTPLSVIKNNIAVYGIQNYITKSYDECNNLSAMVVPGQTSNWNSYQRLDTDLCFAFSPDHVNYDFKIFKSTDDCQSWTSVFDSVGGGTFFTHFAFFDENEGVIAGTFKQLARTKDGGITWIQGSQPISIVTALEAYSDSLVIIGGINSGIGRFNVSKNRGNTWFDLGSGSYFDQQASPRDFFFLNKDTMFAVADMGIAAGTYSVYAHNYAQSFNGGKTWEHSAMPLEEPYGIFFKNAKEGYIVGEDLNHTGVILKTTDLGQTWWKFDTEINENLLDIKFLNDSIALVSGANGLLFKWNAKRTQFTNLSTGLYETPLNDASFKIFPNPVMDKLMFQSDLLIQTKPELIICNTLGEIVYSKANIDLTEALDISFLDSGIYLIKLENGKSHWISKFIKK